MRRIVSLCCALVLAAPAMASDYVALLIANSDYLKPGWDDLETPDHDVDALSGILKDQYGFRVKVLRDATRGDIIDGIEHLKTQVDEDDNVLIYFAGHGILRAGDGGYWVGVDGSTTSRAGWVKYDVINELIDFRAGMKARHVMVIADSCYSGAALRSTGDFASNPAEARAQLLARRFGQRSRTVMTSGGTEPVIDQVAGSKHSVFAAELLDKLRVNQQPLDGYGLFSKIEPEVFARAQRVLGPQAQAPEYGALQGTGHNGGDFVFIPAGMALPDAATAPTTPSDDLGLRGGNERGPRTVLHQNRYGALHLGDENFNSWPALFGQCYDMSVNYPDKLETLTLSYDVYGADSTYVQIGNQAYPFEKMLPLAGKKWPNYWKENQSRVYRVPEGQTMPLQVRICANVVDKPQFAGDKDDFQIRNISLIAN